MYPERLDAAAEKLVDPELDGPARDGSQSELPASPAAPCTPDAAPSAARSFSAPALVAGPAPRAAEPDSRPALAEAPVALSAAVRWVLLHSSAAAEQQGASPPDVQVLEALSQLEAAAVLPE